MDTPAPGNCRSAAMRHRSRVKEKRIPPISPYTDANRAAWDVSAALHEAGPDWSALWDAVTKPGFSSFDETMAITLRALDPDAKRVVQIGCNNGRELLSMPSFGAISALGIDQSAAFLDQARRLAERAGQTPQFLCADIYDLPRRNARSA